MKRQEFKASIRTPDGHDIEGRTRITYAWNSGIKATEDMVRDIARRMGVMFEGGDVEVIGKVRTGQYRRTWTESQGVVLHALVRPFESFICTSCKKGRDVLEEFPGAICLDCYKGTPAATAPVTATQLAQMWGAK